jgi:hypothetical protein
LLKENKILLKENKAAKSVNKQDEREQETLKTSWKRAVFSIFNEHQFF